MTTTYAQMLAVDTLEALEAELLASVSDAGVTSWATESPQFGLLHGEALMARTLQEQRLILAYTASPRQLLRLRSKLVSLGYSAADAAAIVTAWVDVSLGWYGDDMVRIPAQRAEWTIGVKVTATAAPLTIDGTSQAVIQADDGTFFELLQDAAVVLNASSSYKGTVRIRARAAGIVGNVLVGSITTIRGPAGLSIDGTVTQVLALAGRDVETDEAVVARSLAKWGTLGAAWSRDAFDYWIPTVAPTVTRWRVRDDNPFGPGTVGVWLATAAGPASVDEIALVVAKLGARDVKALGSGALMVLPAILHAVTIDVTLASDGLNADLEAQAAAAFAILEAALPIGPARLTESLLVAIAMGGAFDVITLPNEEGGAEVRIALPGFDGVADIASLSITGDDMLADGEVFDFTTTIAVEVGP